MQKLEAPVFFGEWLRRRRKTLDLTREELAARAGCSVFALRKIESGERRPSKQLAGLLADALELPEEAKTTFIRVARGELNVERLQTPARNAAPASLPHPKPAPHHLPLPPTPLLGRDAELAALEQLFKDPQSRLLTLTGMGGIGKTRLAIEFASHQRDMFPDGVHFVPLASINSAESIVPAIAEALEYSFSGPADLKEQLVKHLSVSMNRSALLVLDNLEHLITQSTGTVELISELLRRIPHLKILATSRERLNLQGEWMYELHGLPVPPVEFADRLDDYSAAVLFMQRAQRILTDFAINESEKIDLIRICRMVEGVPLAIELAAVWVGMLTCREIAREIESNIDFLSTNMRDIPERHRSLRATFDHSWKLLSDHEREALSRLSVFHGGFDRSAAERVADATLPLLASLASKSLVMRMEDGRYNLHEVIRQYATAHLGEDKSRCDETCDRHSVYFLQFISNREKALKSGAQQDAIRELAREMDNIRAAWMWAIKRKQFVLPGSAVRSLGWMFEVAGLLREGIEQLEQLIHALRLEERRESWDKLLGTALAHQGLLYFRRGQFPHSQELYRMSIEILRPIGDQAMLADALVYLGVITHLSGDFDAAQSLLEEGLTCAQSVDDVWIAAFAILNLGYIESQRGRYSEGYQQMIKGLQAWRALGDPHSITMGLNFMVPTLLRLGRYEEAKTSMYESIALCEQTRNRWGMGTAHRYLGLVLAEEGQYAEAKNGFRKSLEIFSDYTEGWDIAKTLIYLGETQILSGDIAEAKRNLLVALRLSKEIHSTPLMLDAVTGLASLELSLDPERALGWVTLVADHPAATHETKDRARRLLSEVEKRSSIEQTGAHREQMSSQSLEELVGTILK